MRDATPLRERLDTLREKPFLCVWEAPCVSSWVTDRGLAGGTPAGTERQCPCAQVRKAGWLLPSWED